MNPPKVSILLPAYNHAEYIGEAIESALKQTFSDFELIVVNDGSPDKTEHIVKQIKDPRVHYIYQANQGVPAALNTAFQAASGEYIAILNDDDTWLPTKLATQVNVLDQNPQIGVVYGKAQVIDSDGVPQTQTLSIPGKYPGNMLKSLLYEDCICPVTALIRRTNLDIVGLWDETLPGVDDWDLWIRLARVVRFHFQDQIIAQYRVHATNYSAGRMAHFAAYQELRLKVLDKFFAQNGHSKDILEMRPDAYRNINIAVGLQWIGNGEWKQGFGYLKRAYQVSPSLSTFARIIGNLALHLALRWHLGRALIHSYIRWRLRSRITQNAP